MFNFKYIKDKATPGSWRRGYEYFRKDMVLNTCHDGDTVKAEVKGRFQSEYNIELQFTEDGVKANCSCPLEEEWCKHAVAVGLVSIENNYYEKYFAEKEKREPIFSDTNPPEITEPKGFYKFIFAENITPKAVSLKIIDRKNNEEITNLKPMMAAFSQMQENEEIMSGFSEEQISEIDLIKFLDKYTKCEKGWFNVHFNELDKVLKLLAKVEEVLDEKNGNRLLIGGESWKLNISVNVSIAGNVMLSLHWLRPEPEDIYPLQEVRYFAKKIKWGRYKNLIFPLDTAIAALPGHLTRISFFDIRDADGGKFVYEELPSLKKITNIEISETLEKLALEKSIPTNVLSVELTKDNAIKASLEFEYDETRVPYGKLANKTPYVTVKKPEEDIIYWIKRNLKHEEEAYKMLLATKLTPMQTNNLIVEGDEAIDFYYIIKNTPIGKEWKIEELNDISGLKMSENPLEIHAYVDFEESKDSFTLELSCKIGETTLSIDKVQEYLQNGQKYFYVENEGQVEVPVAIMFHLMKSLNNFDAAKVDDNKFAIKTFRVGFVAELIEEKVIVEMGEKFDKFWNQMTTFNTIEEIKLPKGLKAELRDYQKKGFYWLWFLYSYGLNGILADDMGLGKTIQALTLIQKAKEEDGAQPTLVVCPTSVVFNWEDEMAKFTPKLTCLNLTGAARADEFAKISKSDVVITSYALLRRDITKLKKYNFRFAILDESQNIKNYEAITSKNAKELNAAHKLALSGTPIENKLSELWSVFDFLMPEFLYDIKEFEGRYIVPIEGRGDKLIQSRLKKQIYPFILRRLKSDIAKDLPDKIENVAYCQMTPEQRDLYTDYLDKTREQLFNEIAANGFEKSKMSIFSALLRLRQICNHPYLFDKEKSSGVDESGKFEHLKDMLEDVISNGHRVLLFSQFVEMLKIIKEWLDEKGIKHEYLTGETKNRGDVVKNFNKDDSIPVFLISLKAGGTGLNLTGADYVIHYDPWWNPAVEDQATDRAHRIGQTKNVFVYRLITKGSVEEKIMKLKDKKRDLVDSIISIDRHIGKSMTYEDLKEIFSVD